MYSSWLIMADVAMVEVRAPCPRARGGGRVLRIFACFLLLECKLSWDGDIASIGRVYDSSCSLSWSSDDRNRMEGTISRAARLTRRALDLIPRYSSRDESPESNAMA